MDNSNLREEQIKALADAMYMIETACTLLKASNHCCPVKSRIESTGWGHRGIRFGSRMAGEPVKWAFFRIA